jgi:hypothetical protein
MFEPTCMSRIARSGTSYQLEIEVFWDDSVVVTFESSARSTMAASVLFSH